ncbi:MAG: rod shape-determining protein MreC [Actinomycetota bacterium]|nr:rod shape-determining protein MreC [Actinomycetota bacterium]
MRPRSARRPRRRTVPVLVVLAALTVITLDASLGDDSPVEPLRRAAGEVFGPVQSGMSAAVEPVASIGDFVTTVSRLRDQNADLEARNTELEALLHTSDLDRNRLAELERTRVVASGAGLDVVTAQVVGVGPAQSFSLTVTIDAGTADGIGPDMTVLNGDGLVGRVVRADRTSATVLLLGDAESVVGGRVGSSMELGFLAGDGDLSGSGRLHLTTIDSTVQPAIGDTVVTWGSKDGKPYVAGVPVGHVESLQTSPRDSSTVATVAPFVDFSSLDLVSVVVGEARRTETSALGGAEPNQ